ncbi:hypothetical protein STTU_3402 [Streptomyces sp. Tu6071]|nr:hypothetical protein STTU_3402 [Streptomyces sp. Tu6071]
MYGPGAGRRTAGAGGRRAAGARTGRAQGSRGRRRSRGHRLLPSRGEAAQLRVPHDPRAHLADDRRESTGRLDVVLAGTRRLHGDRDRRRRHIRELFPRPTGHHDRSPPVTGLRSPFLVTNPPSLRLRPLRRTSQPFESMFESSVQRNAAAGRTSVI